MHLDLQSAQNHGSQYPTVRECRQYRVQFSGAILPVLSVVGYSAMALGMLEVQAEPTLSPALHLKAIRRPTLLPLSC